MLNKQFVNKYKDKIPPWGSLGYIVYKRTYARLKDDGTTEEWFETIERCINGISKIANILTQEEEERLFDHIFNFRCCFSGRALWQLGTINVERFGGDSLQNCWQVAVNDPIKPFCFAFNELMLGGGVGFNITPEVVYEMPVVKYAPKVERTASFDCNYIIPDNREGWVNILGKILKSHFYTGRDIAYNAENIRSKGKLIKSFGGIASGGDELCLGLTQISKILKDRVLNKLRPIDVLDIMNIIGKVVVSGNVRRSAQLALGDIKDRLFMEAKNWGRDTIPNWRSLSNNSVVINHYDEITQDYWDGFSGESEPYGLVNLNTCRRYGRMIDDLDYRNDPFVTGVNPCAEITLNSYEACNLGEIFLPNIRDRDQFADVSTLIYKCCKIITTLPFISYETNQVVARNSRLGISLTGFMQSSFRQDSELFTDIYNNLEAEDAKLSSELGINKSIKLTTIKPSGTVSLLAGVTPGAHPAFSEYYIRRIRMAANDPLIKVCREHNYPIEPEIRMDGSLNFDTMVVSFPIQTPKNAICAKEMSVVDQLDNLKWLQTYWADNSVSCTIYYDYSDLYDIQQWLQRNVENIKTVSFLLKSDHNFTQPPMEEIERSQYDELVKDTKPITRVTETQNYETLDSFECAGVCPIK
jgi:adenosylcobalamin-dependent ribonucleoside-triphosphate reductase